MVKGLSHIICNVVVFLTMTLGWGVEGTPVYNSQVIEMNFNN